MSNQYDLTILNCSNSILNIFENEIEPLKTTSYELKKRIREINGNLFFPINKVDVTSYTFFELLSEYFFKINNVLDFDTLKDDDETNKNIEQALKNEGFTNEDITPEKIMKIYFTSVFLSGSLFDSKKQLFNNINTETKEMYHLFFHEIIKKTTPIPYKKGNRLYFNFLFLLIHDYGLEHVDEILDFHHKNSIFSKLFFLEDLKIKVKLIPPILKDELILNAINEWINNKPIIPKIDFSKSEMVIPVDNPILNKTEQADGLQSLFRNEKWEKYLNVFVSCDPPLLKIENDKYHFIGQRKGGKGVIAVWFKYLKQKGIIEQNINRDKIASILSNEINNFSISGATIDNISEIYNSMYEKQLIRLLELAN